MLARSTGSANYRTPATFVQKDLRDIIIGSKSSVPGLTTPALGPWAQALHNPSLSWAASCRKMHVYCIHPCLGAFRVTGCNNALSVNLPCRDWEIKLLLLNTQLTPASPARQMSLPTLLMWFVTQKSYDGFQSSWPWKSRSCWSPQARIGDLPVTCHKFVRRAGCLSQWVASI